MNSEMEGSNVWGDSPLAPTANSANSATANTTDTTNTYNSVPAITAEEDDNTQDEDRFQVPDEHPWGDHQNSSEPYNTYASVYLGNTDENTVDEFKIQNELAQTMKSILLSDDTHQSVDEDEEEEGGQLDFDTNTTGQYDQTDHVHYADDIHRKSDAGNPFLASSLQSGNNDSVEHVNIHLLKEKKNKLISSLTKESNSHGFLESNEEDENKTNPDNLFTVSPTKPDAINNGVDDSPLNNLLNLAGSSSTEPNEKTTSNSDHLSKQKLVVSPNRKIKILRPRRLVKSSLRSEPTTSNNDNPTSVQPNSDGTTSIDPLSAPLQNHNTNLSSDIDPISLSPSSRKQKFIKEAEAPLFNVDRDQVLEYNRQPQLSPSSSTSGINSAQESTNSNTKLIEDENIVKFDITVGDPLKVGELANIHVVYTITTKSKSELLNHEETTVTRRYRDFLWLYHQLLNNHPGYIIPPPPEKQMYGRFDDKFIENRRLALENMLNKISKRKILQDDPDFIVFLQSENFAEESKVRESIVAHNTDNSLDSSSASINNDTPIDTMAQILNATESLGISDSSSSGGFFSSLIGLNIPKYVEEDPFIIEKQSYIEDLDSQLRQLSQSLDMILEKREELTVSLHDVTVVIQQLIDLEVNVEITDLLNNFEELQSKIKEILERGNLSQVLTFGSTIDEYVRLIGSVRNCFENRLKICNSVATLKQHQEKKEHNLAKFKGKNQNQPDKIKKYEDELSRINNVLAKQLKFKEDFDKIFKSELNRFEFSKIKDFKNMVEIYWESLIENQKILIELWESFYEKCKFDN